MDDKTRDMIWFFEFMQKIKCKQRENHNKCKICGSTWLVDSQGLCEECRLRYGRIVGMP